jgi:DNA polymerase-3 subunit epsilon
MSEPTYLVFDTETTGVDTDEDRIVQLVIATADAEGNLMAHREWLIDPGVPIPEEATAVHGLTNAYLEENGEYPGTALEEALAFFEQYEPLTWVAYNLNYDLSILKAEFERHLLLDIWWMTQMRLFDPLIVDRAKDKWRKGKRKLFNVAEHYGVAYDAERLHNALYDVEITAKVAAKVAGKYGIPSNAEQADMHRAWAENFESYLRGVKKDDTIVIEKSWPLREKEEA